MTAEPPPDWLGQGLGPRIPVIYQSTSQGKGLASKKEMLRGLRRLQRYLGCLMLVSVGAGIYLLATDGSLWHEAVSHAAGLIVIVVIDLLLAYLNFAGSKRAYLPSVAAAVLAIGLQLGDIMTAPQYHMTAVYFAHYLFGLWAFDTLLVAQALVIIIWAYRRSDMESLARRSVGKDLRYSRRTFLTNLVGFAGLIGLGVIASSIKLPPPPPPRNPGGANGATTSESKSSTNGGGRSTSTTALPKGAIANTSSMPTDTPIYFEYPSGYPNVVLKASDGSLAAFSMLCTHTCCEVSWYAAQQIFFCACHGSEFNAAGNVVRGPAPTRLPTVTLRVDSAGNIFPTGVTGFNPCGA
jgi:Rieske Fe-S protein